MITREEAQEAAEALRTYINVAPHPVDAAMAKRLNKVADELQRAIDLEFYAREVYDNLKKDREQGYKTRSSEYVVSMLGKGLGEI